MPCTWKTALYHDMRKSLSLLVAFLFAGCLASAPDESGGPTSVVVTKSNVDAIISSAQSVFAEYNYTTGPVNYPNSISFDKPASGFGRVMWGGYDMKTIIRAKLSITPLANGKDFSLHVSVYAVRDGGMAGMTDKQKLMGMWAMQFKPILTKIQAQASNQNL